MTTTEQSLADARKDRQVKTFKVTGYQAYGTRDPSSYFVQVSYRGEKVAEFSGDRASEYALRYVAKNGGRAVVSMGDSA